MSHRLRLLSAVTIVLLAGGYPDVWGSNSTGTALHVVNDFAAIQGTWEIVTIEYGGRPVKSLGGPAAWRFRGDQLTRLSMEDLNKRPEPPPDYRFELDPRQRPGWFAISVNRLHGQEYAYFLEFEPVGMAGYSLYIYNISKDEVVQQSPSLADKVALRTSDYSIEEIAAEIAAIITSS